MKFSKRTEIPNFFSFSLNSTKTKRYIIHLMQYTRYEIKQGIIHSLYIISFTPHYIVSIPPQLHRPTNYNNSSTNYIEEQNTVLIKPYTSITLQAYFKGQDKKKCAESALINI